MRISDTTLNEEDPLVKLYINPVDIFGEFNRFIPRIKNRNFFATKMKYISIKFYLTLPFFKKQ